MGYPRQHYEVRARIVAPNAHTGGVTHDTHLLYSGTGGPETEQAAKEMFEKAGQHMLAGDNGTWYTEYWQEVIYMGPNGAIDAVKRPAEEAADASQA